MQLRAARDVEQVFDLVDAVHQPRQVAWLEDYFNILVKACLDDGSD